ncbi:UDP-N-acetylglucosamine--dolichyl-phosphate N-acetylglucosaminyltransferase [uncultured archaeon]|nr:UDP-N-acetylglucosamine--dolichyl-phosphate N-acetylglucosaminyltransferase [uncultured archaeon]
MWKGKKVSVVFSTYNEKNSIRKCIDDFFKTGYVDEVIAVDNNAAPGTKEEIKKTKAKYFLEEKQGFGHGYRRALKEAKGDIIIMTEPDGTFDPNDIIKFLAYSDNIDVIFGTRTTSIMIGEGANMGWFLKWGNYAVAKLIEVLFNTSHLSDVGCTYRMIKKDAYNKIKDKFVITGMEFNPDMMLQVVRNNITYIEIPIKYLRRVGVSSATGDFKRTVFIGFKMIWLIFKHRLGIIKK